MIPVLDLNKIRQFVANQSPAERKRIQDHSRELLKAAIESTEKCKRICEERGIPYVPAIAAQKHPMSGYCK